MVSSCGAAAAVQGKVRCQEPGYLGMSSEAAHLAVSCHPQLLLFQPHSLGTLESPFPVV